MSIADGHKKLFRAFKGEAVQFLVAKNLAVSQLPLKAFLLFKRSNCKRDRKIVVTWHFVVSDLRFSIKKADAKGLWWANSVHLELQPLPTK